MDSVGLKVAETIVGRFVPEGVVTIAVDATLHAKGGKNVFGAGTHPDPQTSARAHAQLQFGPCWVTPAIIVSLPFAVRPRALRVLFRLNMPVKMAAKWGVAHRKRTGMASDLVRIFAAPLPDRSVRVVNDNLYSYETLPPGLPAGVELVGRLNLEAVLFAPVESAAPGTMGWLRTWGRGCRRRSRSPRARMRGKDGSSTSTGAMSPSASSPGPHTGDQAGRRGFSGT